ncbi:unnamed protein product [Nesidiocoris tenuis]|uniref:Non-specific serine/threonine protein kinase n=1 Tax=Nesidiocoris tenuis TaxID=355587 RepID=A0A6H5G1E6_9HEMI|nr:unnamed protein product [Nesidiocoris tenuis]
MLQYNHQAYTPSYPAYPSLLLLSRYNNARFSRLDVTDWEFRPRAGQRSRIDPSGIISRGRSVVRIKTRIGGPSPGKRLIEKFIIPERPARTETVLARSARLGDSPTAAKIVGEVPVGAAISETVGLEANGSPISVESVEKVGPPSIDENDVAEQPEESRVVENGTESTRTEEKKSSEDESRNSEESSSEQSARKKAKKLKPYAKSKKTDLVEKAAEDEKHATSCDELPYHINGQNESDVVEFLIGEGNLCQNSVEARTTDGNVAEEPPDLPKFTAEAPPGIKRVQPLKVVALDAISNDDPADNSKCVSDAKVKVDSTDNAKCIEAKKPIINSAAATIGPVGIFESEKFDILPKKTDNSRPKEPKIELETVQEPAKTVSKKKIPESGENEKKSNVPNGVKSQPNSDDLPEKAPQKSQKLKDPEKSGEDSAKRKTTQTIKTEVKRDKFPTRATTGGKKDSTLVGKLSRSSNCESLNENIEFIENSKADAPTGPKSEKQSSDIKSPDDSSKGKVGINSTKDISEAISSQPEEKEPGIVSSPTRPIKKAEEIRPVDDEKIVDEKKQVSKKQSIPVNGQSLIGNNPEAPAIPEPTNHLPSGNFSADLTPVTEPAAVVGKNIVKPVDIQNRSSADQGPKNEILVETGKSAKSEAPAANQTTASTAHKQVPKKVKKVVKKKSNKENKSEESNKRLSLRSLDELSEHYEEYRVVDSDTKIEDLSPGWEIIEVLIKMEGVKKKKKVIVKKKGSKVKKIPLEAKPPKSTSEMASPGDIYRQLSKKRVSLADEDLNLVGFNPDKRVSITDQVLVEEAALLDEMISKELRDARKSSLAFPPISEDSDCELEAIAAKSKLAKKPTPKPVPPSPQERREMWKKNALRKSLKSLGGFYKPKAREESSSSSESDDDSEDDSQADGGRVSPIAPPAKTLPRFRTYTINDFQFLKVLGKGSFGKVLLAELKDTRCYYAVKCLKKDVVLEDDDVECTMIERKVLALGTGHPYFCHLFCTFQTESHLFFVMEYLNGGDLMFHIQQSGRFDEGRARFYAAEIVSALTFLHKLGIVYRDLKLDNVLLDFDGHVRIADFGMCKLQIYLDKTTDTFCGTPDYMAPEVIKGLKYNQCVDWWSFGILLYEMLVGQSPFSGCDEDHLFWSICNERPHMPRHLSQQAIAILRDLLEKDWSKRLGSSEFGSQDVMNHTFFDGMKWHMLERRQIDPPYKPSTKHPLDTKYFDRAFTSEKPVLTPVEKSILETMDQSQFEGFSYTNPNVTE